MRSQSETNSPAPPPLTGRVHYLIGGTLAPSHRDWVVADLTGKGWRHRQALRPVLLMLPFALVFALLPGSASLRVSIPLLLMLMAVVMGYTTSDTFRNRRLAQYGIPRPKPIEEDEYDEDETPVTPDPDGDE